jgi:uncharacterized protein YjbI with pentapeptide repeats
MKCRIIFFFILFSLLVGCGVAVEDPSEGKYRCLNGSFDPNSIKDKAEIKKIYCRIEDFTDVNLSSLALFENLEDLSLISNNQSSDKVIFNSDWTPKLKILYLDSIKFETISLSALKNVERITISSSDMPEIDVTNLNTLTYLNINKTNLELETLDLSYNPEIQRLKIDRTNIKDLTFSNNDKLFDIELFSINIQTIELINLPSLTGLTMHHGVLEKLYIDLPNLEYAVLKNNKLTSVDFSGSPELSSLDLSNNLITDINVDVNEKLTRLDLTGNPLSEKTKAYLDTLTWIEDLKY